MKFVKGYIRKTLVDVQTGENNAEVKEGLICDSLPFGLTKDCLNNTVFWNITHIPTGWRIPVVFNTESEAAVFLEKLSKENFDWGFHLPEKAKEQESRFWHFISTNFPNATLQFEL